MFSLLSVVLAFPFVTFGPGGPAYEDADHDGIPDRWETDGYGPINPKTMGCKPNHADIFIVFRMRSGMKQETIQPTIDRMKKFYAELPHKNADGTTGIHMVAIVPPPMPKESDTLGYQDLYEKAMPLEWRGIAHGILVDNSPGGGGQSNRADWAGTGYNWPTMVHELGHQLGLPHEPLGSRVGSPYHRSLMNYDYSYQLGGNGEAIMYSDGKFASLKMHEDDLDETVPFTLTDLDFLTKQPYYFKLKKIDDKHTAVDWNRNGIFGEKHVRANINDGYSITLPITMKMGKAAGAPALAALDKTLLSIFPSTDSTDIKDWDLKSLTRAKPGKLMVQTNQKDNKPQVLVPSGVCGDPSVAVIRDELWTAYPTANGYAYGIYKQDKTGLALKSSGQADLGEVEPTLVSTPHGVLLLAWDSKTKSVSIGKPGDKLNEMRALSGLTSQQPVGAVWNSKRKELAVAIVVHQANFDGCIKIVHFNNAETGWLQQDFVWVGNDKGGARTSGRPLLIFDATRDRGPMGAYNVYVKGQYADPAQPGLNFCCRQIGEGEGWRIKMMGNEWANSRSVCGVTEYKGDIAYAYRWYSGPEDNLLWVAESASGVEHDIITDFDEVTFIFEHGLQDSLKSVQQEQWKKH